MIYIIQGSFYDSELEVNIEFIANQEYFTTREDAEKTMAQYNEEYPSYHHEITKLELHK